MKNFFHITAEGDSNLNLFESGFLPVHSFGLEQASVDSGRVKERWADVEAVDDQQFGNR